MNKHTKLVCGKPPLRKNSSNLSKGCKGHRVKTTAEEILYMLEVISEEETKRTLLAITRKRPDILKHLNWIFFIIG